MRRPLASTLVLLTLAAPALGQRAPVAPNNSWVERSALYEVFVTDFSRGGNLRGVTAGLPRIAATGADVIWLMPIQPRGIVARKGTYGSPYAIRDYMAIDSAYGTPADLRALVRAAHARHIKVILDWVPDHTSPDAVWVTQHPDYYVHVNGQLTVPIDPQGHATDWTDVVMIDFHNPALRAAMTEAMRRWLVDYDLDGFRVDAVGFTPLDYWRDAIAQLRAAAHRPILMLAEWGDMAYNGAGFDLTYSWDAYGRIKNIWRGAPASMLADSEAVTLRAMPEGGARMRFTTNHDETGWDNPPVILFNGPAGARAAYVATALLPGRPLLYNGQEVESYQRLRLFEHDPLDWSQPRAAQATAFYRRIIGLARSDSAFLRGDFAPLTTSAPNDVVAYRRGEAVVLVNARNIPASFTVTGASVAGLTDVLTSATQRGDTVSLPAYGAVVLEHRPTPR